MTIEAHLRTHAISEDEKAAQALLTPDAVRERSIEIFRVGQSGALSHFSVHEDRLPQAASYIATIIRDNYPSLDVPYHSRWRHFRTRSSDRWQGLWATLKKERGPEEISRTAFDLVVVSVLLDAGAGPDWSYSPVGEENLGEGGYYSRSEGLALASFDAFAAGLFSSSKADPFRCDASALMALEEKELAAAFQVSPENPLVGIEGRVALLRSLGAVMAGDDIHFDSESPRIGDLFDFLLTQKDGVELSARTILITVLEALGPIWPDRIALGGINLGDTWRHSAIKRDDPTNGLIPFHKLSQWLSYSLFEPLEWAGLKIRDPGLLTGLAEYRNGGLFIDLDIIQPKDPRILQDVFRPEDQQIVEWRALTIVLLDLVAPMVRAELGLHEDDFPLAKVLEGGTWAAGRRIAGERRKGGGPPISIESDGAVF